MILDIFLKTKLTFYKLVCHVAFSLMVLLSLVTPSFAQSTISDSTSSDEVVRRVRFSGNKFVKDRTLETLVRTRTNREFLAIPRFTPWYYFWKLSNGRFGEEPTLLDRQVVVKRHGSNQTLL
ncbi:MAG: hypothetical protein BalsKO_14280 [Balneolaceae bacterium]